MGWDVAGVIRMTAVERGNDFWKERGGGIKEEKERIDFHTVVMEFLCLLMMCLHAVSSPQACEWAKDSPYAHGSETYTENIQYNVMQDLFSILTTKNN